MALTEAELKQALTAELAQADGFESDELSNMRRRALDMLYRRPRGDELNGRSTMQSGDLADSIDAMVATVLPAFSGDSISEFEPESDDDVEQAQLESDVVNKVILEFNNGYVELQSALRDALLLRNGWMKCWLDEDIEAFTRELTAPDEETLALALAELGSQPEIEIEIREVKAIDGEWHARVRLTRTRETFRCQAIDPVNIRWQADYDSPFIEDGMRFLAERWLPTRSELVKAGYSRAKVERLRRYDGTTNLDERARYRGQFAATQIADPAMDQIESYWCYYRYDSNNDGRAELHRVLLAGGAGEGAEILENKVVAFAPYATGTPFLQPHQMNGLGFWDKLHDLADAKTDIWRSWLDNLAVSNFPETAVNVRKVSMDDATNRQPGGLIRVDGEPGVHIAQLPAMDNGASAQLALDYADKVRTERVGASLDLQAAQLQIAGDTAHGIERQFGTREQLAAMVTRTLAETLIRQLFQIAHRGMREWMTQPLNVRIRGKFQESQPSGWRPRQRVNVRAGMSIGERAHRRQVMSEVIMQQEKLAQAGYDGVLVQAEQYHSALQDWLRASMIEGGERYFLDPASEESQAAAKQKAAAAEQAQNQQLQIAQAAATAEQQAQAIKSAIDKYRQDTDIAFQYWKESLEVEIRRLEQQIEADSIEQQERVGRIRSDDAQAAGEGTSGQRVAG